MTEQDWIDLGKRAVACAGWRWMPGMRAGLPDGARWPLDEGGNGVLSLLEHWQVCWAEAVPDLTDPATIGCLLALVREAWGCPEIGVCLFDQAAHIYDGHTEDGRWIAGEDTEAAALVAALEAAPEPEAADD